MTSAKWRGSQYKKRHTKPSFVLFGSIVLLYFSSCIFDFFFYSLSNLCDFWRGPEVVLLRTGQRTIHFSPASATPSPWLLRQETQTWHQQTAFSFISPVQRRPPAVCADTSFLGGCAQCKLLKAITENLGWFSKTTELALPLPLYQTADRDSSCSSEAWVKVSTGWDSSVLAQLPVLQSVTERHYKARLLPDLRMAALALGFWDREMQLWGRKKKERGYVKGNIAGRKRKTFSWNKSKLEAEWEVWEFIQCFQRDWREKRVGDREAFSEPRTDSQKRSLDSKGGEKKDVDRQSNVLPKASVWRRTARVLCRSSKLGFLRLLILSLKQVPLDKIFLLLFTWPQNYC